VGVVSAASAVCVLSMVDAAAVVLVDEVQVAGLTDGTLGSSTAVSHTHCGTNRSALHAPLDVG
jgi:hypothetical protein